jgi:hypothetical protein
MVRRPYTDVNRDTWSWGAWRVGPALPHAISVYVTGGVTDDDDAALSPKRDRARSAAWYRAAMQRSAML